MNGQFKKKKDLKDSTPPPHTFLSGTGLAVANKKVLADPTFPSGKGETFVD